ncbi:unnamed protein product [Lasius platythorax]|uniref:Uncharacterized protein n=1 Tax=Lasius platythorax TaxID=488582 RepID=A0AAV2N6T2_9HYME
MPPSVNTVHHYIAGGAYISKTTAPRLFMLVPGRFERRCRAGERFLHLLLYKRYIEADDTNLASVNVAGIISQGCGDTDHAIVQP